MTNQADTHFDTTAASVQLVTAVRAHTRRELAAVGLRLARTLAARFDSCDAADRSGLADPSRDALSAALAFAEQYERSQTAANEPPPSAHPLLRLAGMARSPAVADMLKDLVLLASLPEAHEGHTGSLLSLLLSAGVEIDHTCGGVCACSTCHVYVEEGFDSAPEPIEEEEDQLDFAPALRDTSRLSCQCVPDGSTDVVVEIPEWSRNEVSEDH